jgi:hypothetical protein
MTGITTILSILTLNINGLISSSKTTVWKTGLKRKTHLFNRNKHWLSERLEEDLLSH